MSNVMKIVQVEAIGLEPTPLLRRLHDDEIQAVVVRGVYRADVVAGIVQRLEAMPDHPLWQHRDYQQVERTQHRVLGEPVSASDLHREGPERESYFVSSEATRRMLADVFPDSRPFEETIEAVLEAFGGGAAVETACDSGGRRYGAATVRAMYGGRGLPPHCENDYMANPIYDGLRERVELADQLSFFMPLALPEGGGELVVHARRWQPRDPDADEEAGRASPDGRVGLEVPHEVVDAQPGDLVIFPAGRTIHSVRDWGSPEVRWTIGGFGAFTCEGDGFLHWA